MSDSPLKVWLDRDGTLLRLRLARPKANIVDAAMIAALRQALAEHRGIPELRAALLDHEGPHFSFGASVDEHMPDQCADMLKSLHALIRDMLDFPLPLLVAIKGQCLGGGLEVAAAGSMLFAAPDAKLGQPEIKLAVFAPAASCLLPERIGQAKAEDLLFSGRSMAAEEALATGLIDNLSDDPETAALAYFDKALAPSSASTLRFAVRAAREEYRQRVTAKLERVETLYLAELMQTHDAVEGLTAFVEKRPAQWKNC
ncbi:cyclohexa-1,5-dienecarbonyl-CoA hydratase [Geothermobacter hydrogeniphilus]|uniref:Cyclohexa-1,5-dienecarbonyl-CoA hydratase n=1 Tax=Geothermobacter hydrogeniphilus TaxID=1969733 RepID=A0A1X0Y258_9BACT|nr:cyclohexa-1,5-dienecarbonyl-CoA hydratase [Geothermobacter hydrogeniphilus]ORJ59255.1 cyclohexa-1,5-dienecarbonyl-CoA hydratase [Geothermobacter hydrogeniphilus]